TPEERPKKKEVNAGKQHTLDGVGPAFHEKKLKNTKFNQGGSYLRKARKHKNPITRGDKAQGGNKKKRRG
ncbi:MAG: ATP-dependent RNA helicase RhlE, partial [Nonlabens sp.]